MKSIRSMIKVTVCGVFLFLSLSSVATADTTQAKADQSAERIGGQAGMRMPLERRTIAADSLGGIRVGSQAGQERDPETPDSEAK